MAKCDLSIELDDPDRIYVGGDKISGTVHVSVDDDVKCKGLEIASVWRTHGRGNIASGTAETTTAFAGEWMAGDAHSYRFELNVAAWPPSYHGGYINVDHYIDARAKIPWAFDPKTSREFLMRPTDAPESETPGQAVQVPGCIGNGIIAVVLIAVVGGIGGILFALTTNPIAAAIAAAIFFPIVGLIAGKILLPKWKLGNVESELLTPVIAPGGRVRARLAFQTRRQVQINAITAELTGTEVCVSGSGSNRTTHRNVFFTDRHELEGETLLQAGTRREFNLDFPIPGDVPYSFDLADNDLNWTIELRVDIPRWPDWTTSLKLQVMPDGETSAAGPVRADEAMSDQRTGPAGSGDFGDVADEITFVETATHLWKRRDDADQVDRLVGAVQGMTFEFGAYVERRLLYSGEEDPHVYRDGYAVWAHHREPPLPLVLYIPHEMADEFEQVGTELWQCRGTIVGWDHSHRRLQIKVLAD